MLKQLAKPFRRRFLKISPKNEQKTSLNIQKSLDHDHLNKLERDPPKVHPHQVWSGSGFWFLRSRKYNCGRTDGRTEDDRRQMTYPPKSSADFKKKNLNLNTTTSCPPLTLPGGTVPPSFSTIWQVVLEKSKIVKTHRNYIGILLPPLTLICSTGGFGKVKNSKNTQKFKWKKNLLQTYFI